MNFLRVSRYTIAALIIGGLVWQLARQDRAALFALPQPSIAALAVACALGTMGYFAFAGAWISLHAHGRSWRSTGGVWFASLLARYVPGGLWQGAIRVVDAHLAGESRRRVLERYLAEQALTCFSAAWVAVTLVLMAQVPLARPVLIALATVAIGALATAQVGPRLGVSLQWTRVAVAAVVSGHLAMALGFAAFVGAWSAPSDLREIATLMAMFLIAGVAGLLAVFVPAGLGVRESVLAALLAPMLGSANAIALSLGARIWLLACELTAWSVWVLATRRHGSARSRGPASTGKK